MRFRRGRRGGRRSYGRRRSSYKRRRTSRVRPIRVGYRF